MRLLSAHVSPLGKSEEKDAVSAAEARIRQAVGDLGLSYGKLWRILRKRLKCKSYRHHKVQILSAANMESRLSPCSFWLTFTEDWFEMVLWSDEKWFVLNQHPNRKNDCQWAPANPHNLGFE
jgi:hypothetical protein